MSIRFIDKIFGNWYYIMQWQWQLSFMTQLIIFFSFLQLDMAVVEREEKGKALLKLFQTHFMQEQ